MLVRCYEVTNGAAPKMSVDWTNGREPNISWLECELGDGRLVLRVGVNRGAPNSSILLSGIWWGPPVIGICSCEAVNGVCPNSSRVGSLFRRAWGIKYGCPNWSSPISLSSRVKYTDLHLFSELRVLCCCCWRWKCCCCSRSHEAATLVREGRDSLVGPNLFSPLSRLVAIALGFEGGQRWAGMCDRGKLGDGARRPGRARVAHKES